MGKLASLHRIKLDDGEADTRVSSTELASALGKVKSTVARWMKPALEHGWAEEVEPAKGNKPAFYMPGNKMPDLSLLPPVDELAEEFPEMAENFKVVDPLTGEQFVLEAEAVKTNV